MPTKKAHRPRVVHKAFSPTMYRLVGDDWIILLHNPHNGQACLFLAEPVLAPDGPAKGQGIGYWVSALERVGESASALKGLPRSFKTTLGAAEWLEERMESYAGDVFAGADERVAEDA
jgi:hypothetical protein